MFVLQYCYNPWTVDWDLQFEWKKSNKKSETDTQKIVLNSRVVLFTVVSTAAMFYSSLHTSDYLLMHNKQSKIKGINQNIRMNKSDEFKVVCVQRLLSYSSCAVMEITVLFYGHAVCFWCN